MNNLFSTSLCAGSALAAALLFPDLAAQEARFVPNQGQWDSPDLYRMRTGGLQMFLESRGWSLWVVGAPEGDEQLAGSAAPVRGMSGIDSDRATRRAVAVRMSFRGADAAELVPERELRGASHFLSGATSQHRRGVPGFGAVRYKGLYEGVDVLTRIADGAFEYDLLIDGETDLDAVQIQVEGATGLTLAEDGSLVLQTAVGDLVQPRPATWMVGADGERLPVACDYVLLGSDSFGFEAPDRTRGRALVVDPPILYSTYVGGSALDEPTLVREDSQGRTLMCGYTVSLDFPSSPGAIQTGFGGLDDGFMICLDPRLPPANQLVFATYFGGTFNDSVGSICEVPGRGYAFCGWSESPGLPTTPGAVQPAKAAGRDGFVGMLDPTGTQLTALTYLGGGGLDRLSSVFPHPTGTLVVSGSSRSSDFPTTANALQNSSGGGPSVGQDGVLAMLTPDAGSLLWSTYLGGSGDDWGYIGDVDAAGRLAVFGATSSRDLPTTANAVWPRAAGAVNSPWWAVDAYVFVIDPLQAPAQQVVYGTYVGGGGSENAFRARFASNGDLVVAGTAASDDFPTTAGAYQETHAGGGSVSGGLTGDAYVVRIDPNASGSAGLRWSTFVGGNGMDQLSDMAVDTDDSVCIVGWTRSWSPGWPTTPNALRRTYASNDGYVARLSADGGQLLYSTLLGGTRADGCWLVEAHAPGIMTVGTSTQSIDFPVQNAAQPVAPGGVDAALTRLDMIADGTARYGSATAGAAGSKPTMHAMSDAVPGNAAFGVACSNAGAGRAGVLFFAARPANALPFLGIELSVDPGAILLGLPLSPTDSRGETVTPLPLPATGLGTLYMQYVFLEPAASQTLLSSSDALQVF